MKRLLAAMAAVSLLAAAGPALAGPTNGACKAPKDAIVLKPGGKAFEAEVATPVGAFNGFGAEEVGEFFLDLSGKPSGTKGKLTLTLSWANPASDYDLVVNGNNAEATDNPEINVTKATHCKAITVETDVYLGVPSDKLTLQAKAS